MIDWSFPLDLQAQYDRVLAETRRLQQELGIKPMTLEERYQAYLARQIEERRKEELRQEELKKIQEKMSKMRPPPKWKV